MYYGHMDNILQSGSDSAGKSIYYHDTINKNQWQEPVYLKTLPIELRGEVMYNVHTILENIQVSASDYMEVMDSYGRLSEIPEFRTYIMEQVTYMKDKIN